MTCNPSYIYTSLMETSSYLWYLPYPLCSFMLRRTMATITASPFRLALCQLGSLTSNKTQNLTIASSAVKEAVQKGKANLVVLPEIFNSPYAVNSFRKYAEVIPGRDKCPVDDSGLEGSESLVALSKMAKENNVWLIGGEPRCLSFNQHLGSSPLVPPRFHSGNRPLHIENLQHFSHLLPVRYPYHQTPQSSSLRYRFVRHRRTGVQRERDVECRGGIDNGRDGRYWEDRDWNLL